MEAWLAALKILNNGLDKQGHEAADSRKIELRVFDGLVKFGNDVRAVDKGSFSGSRSKS